MNTGQGISALDPTVGLLQKELEVNNVSPGQEAQYFQSKGRPLSPQLVFLIQANQQLQKDMQGAQAQLPKSTVADDLSTALVRKANSGIAQAMPRAAPPMDPREQGIARLPTQVGSSRAYASGGIVAFAGGGGIESEIAKLEAAIKADDYIKQEVGGSLGRAISSRTMPMGYADRKQAERRLEQLKLAQPMFAGAPASQVVAGSSPVIYNDGPAQTQPPGKIGGPKLPPAASPSVSSAAAVPPARSPGIPSLNISPETPAGAAPDQQDPYLKWLKDQFGMTDEQFLKQEAARRAASGMDAAQQARQAELDKRRAYTMGLADTEAKQKKKDLMMQLAASAFGSVGKGRTFVQSLGNIGSGFAQGAVGVEQEYRGKAKERQQALNAIKDAELVMQEAEAARKMGDYKTYEEKKAQAATAMYGAGVQERKLKVDERANYLRELGLKDQHAYRMAQIAANKEIASTRAQALLARTQGLTPAQMANLRAKAIDKIDEDSIRNQLARTLKLSKTPKAGADAEFERRFKEARENTIRDKMADILQIPQSNLRVADVMGDITSVDGEE